MRYLTAVLAALCVVSGIVLSSCQKSAQTGNPSYTLTVFSESRGSDSRSYSIAAAGNSMTVITNDYGSPSEGYVGLQARVSNLSWIRMEITNTPMVCTNYASGYINFTIKTVSPRFFMVGVRSAGGQEAWVPLTASHYSADGNWHFVSLPVGDFSGVDLSQITAVFLLSNSNSVTAGDAVYLDDIHWSSYPSSSAIWKVAWEDEFNTFDTANWTYEIGNNAGWGNAELQEYTATNSVISNGYLVITAHFNQIGDPTGVNYTSTRIKTQEKRVFRYGRIAARMRLDINAQGAWPAFWMLGTNITTVGWPACGEIDIMECGLNGVFNSVGGALHWSKSDASHTYSSGTVTLASGTFADNYHIFEIEWTSAQVIWRLDGKEFYRLSTSDSVMSEFRNYHFIIINLAIGGVNTSYTGRQPVGYTQLPDYVFVDWVRVYQPQ